MSADLLVRLRARLAATDDPTLREMLVARIRELEPSGAFRPRVGPSGCLETEYYPFERPPRRWMRRRGEPHPHWLIRITKRQAEIDAAAREEDDDG